MTGTQANSLIDGADGAEPMLMSPTSLRSEQTAGMLTSPSRSMLSSRFDAAPPAGEAAAAAAAAAGSTTVSAMVTPRSMGRGSAGDSMTSSRTLTVTGEVPAHHGGAPLQASQRRPAVGSQGVVKDAGRRQHLRRAQPQAQLQQPAHPVSAMEPDAPGRSGPTHVATSQVEPVAQIAQHYEVRRFPHPNELI